MRKINAYRTQISSDDALQSGSDKICQKWIAMVYSMTKIQSYSLLEIVCEFLNLCQCLDGERNNCLTFAVFKTSQPKTQSLPNRLKIAGGL